MASPSALITGMVAAAKAGGRSLLKDYKTIATLGAREKAPGDFVSAADERSEKIIQCQLAKLRPKAAFLLEEGGAIGDINAAERWIVDPLDGTKNFLHSIGHWSISIALERNGAIVAGVIYDPVKREVFWAERGKGAWCGTQRLKVSSKASPEFSLSGIGSADRIRAQGSIWSLQVTDAKKEMVMFRRLGSAALDLAYVAAGRFDAYWDRNLGAWDVAAGWLLVTEAGGTVTHQNGRPFAFKGKDLLATNTLLHKAYIKLLKKGVTLAKTMA